MLGLFLPRNTVRFFNYATEQILLQKVGGGSLSVHHLSLDYLLPTGRRENRGTGWPSPVSQILP